MKKVAILGASGSIGSQTIEVLKHLKKECRLVAFSVGKNIEYANSIINDFEGIELVCVQNKEDINKVNFDNVVYGEEGLILISKLETVDVVLTAVVGSIGLLPTIEAIKAKKDIALANKETLVMAGHIIMPLAQEYGISILPVDSEHSAIFQCLNGENTKEINKIIITASGGSFRDKTLEELEGVTKKEALNHPNWSMGQKITIDSATMINKGFEVIEAHHLFNIDYENIQTIIHKESMIHSMVEFLDGSVMAQIGESDMKVPIAYALTYPNRYEVGAKKLDLDKLTAFNFQKMDYERFEGLKIAYDVGKKGHSYPSVLNAANEMAVELFLEDKIEFLTIIEIIKKEVDRHEVILDPQVEQLVKLTKDIKNKIKKEYS